MHLQDIVDARQRENGQQSPEPLEPPANTDEATIADESYDATPHQSPLEFNKKSQRLNIRSHPGTPAMKSGPPRSLSFNYSVPSTPAVSRDNSRFENADIGDAGGFPFYFQENAAAEFRGVELGKGENIRSRRGKRRESRWDSMRDTRRESRLGEGDWNPLKWFHESPTEERSGFHFGDTRGDQETAAGTSNAHSRENTNPSAESPRSAFRRALTFPHSPDPDLNSATPNAQTPAPQKPGAARWGRLRSFLPNIVQQNAPPPATPGPSAVTSHKVNITDELISGGLSTLCLGLWFERDEKNHRRVPVLLHRLRLRVSDSLHPLHGHKAVFRIECEYANGAARWVVYRQLRDFFSLHAHYAFSNAYNRNVDNLPEFPRTSLPYFKFLKKQSKEKGGSVGTAEFARMQREALETYLIDLIRAVMFHPSANRLAGFLEISALSIAMAPSGGTQLKAGYLRLDSSGTLGGGFGRKSASWSERKRHRWCAVRESYLVVMEEAGELTIWDVFLFDADFKIERPKRYYRNWHFFSSPSTEKVDVTFDRKERLHFHQEKAVSKFGSIARGLSRIIHPLSHHHHEDNKREGGDEGHANGQHHMNRAGNGFALTGPGADSDDGSSSSSDASSVPSRAGTPMLDPSTNVNPLSGGADRGDGWVPKPDDEDGKDEKGKKKKNPGDVSKHTFFIQNSQMRLRLLARNERQTLQWITALERAAARSHYTGRNRFGSFAPIRLNVAAQWLVDGRDYFWNLSRAILLARESIYIHDWWLSPELQLRRPNKERYRLDNLLQRKAREGVKIYVILYAVAGTFSDELGDSSQEVSNRTTPTDSNYAKQRLTGLHPNVMVQRSPSHFQTGTFYWAHHEKMCVIDQAIAFMGGVDLCFGRWDTAQHVLTDDVDQETGASEIWPGKDYSNPRITDFHDLNKPEQDMYDRSKVPRMPWHDVGLQVVGQPARDLARHFVARWNYLLRIKNHTRVMPFLLPPPDFRPGELTRMGLTGTCEMQICRSAGPWSMGTPGRVEFSIQNAYLKAIQLSEHFVYIENQFFITSTVVNDVKVENKIGDALVARIIRAHREGTPWKCCIIIPLLPGFSFPVDYSDASAIRIILECQNRTISRGPNSIFSRLRKEGIDPDDYIAVFSLRNWAKLRGDVLTTEMVYIHGKICIVDDRVAIIGSANINERSMRGERDSELAAVIRDTDMIDSTMAGKPFQVGRFAHTLRVRLMREHLGVDVDAMDEDDLMAAEPTQREDEQEPWDPDAEQKHGKDEGVTHLKKSRQHTAGGALLHDTVGGIEQVLHGTEDAGTSGLAKTIRKLGIKSKGLDNTAGDAALTQERTTFTKSGEKEPGFASSMVPTLEEKIVAEHIPPPEHVDDAGTRGGGTRQTEKEQDRDGNRSGKGENVEKEKTRLSVSFADDSIRHAQHETTPPSPRASDGTLYGAPANASPSAGEDDQAPHAREADDVTDAEKAAPEARSTIRKQLNSGFGSGAWTLPTPKPVVDPDRFEDPIAREFWDDMWLASAVHNTEIFRKVFHAVPDDLITTWKQYKEFMLHHERLNKPAMGSSTPEPVARVPSEADDEGAPAEAANPADMKEGAGEKVSRKQRDEGEPGETGAGSGGRNQKQKHAPDDLAKRGKEVSGSPSEGGEHTTEEQAEETEAASEKGTKKRSAKGVEPFEEWERDEMEKLLLEVCGHLVIYPNRFLEGEDIANNFLFTADRILPMPIYD